MSSMQLSPAHIARTALAVAHAHHPAEHQPDPGNVLRLAERRAAAYARAVYDGSHATGPRRPDPLARRAYASECAAAVTAAAEAEPLQIVAALKLLQSVDYQACDSHAYRAHTDPSTRNSPTATAATYAHDLDRLVTRLPGWDAAPWVLD